MKEKFQSLEFQGRLQSYLAGDLDETERLAFETELRASEGAQEEQAFSRRLAFVLHNRELLEVNQLAKKAVQEAPPPPPSPGMNGRLWWIAGITAFALISAASFFAYSAWQAKLLRQEASALALAYLEPLENLLHTDSTTDASLVLGMNAYDKGEYKPAAEWLEGYYKRHSDGNVALYLAVAQIFDGQSEEAQLRLGQLVATGRGPVKHLALWYQVLACLQVGEVAKARQLLTQLEAEAPGISKASELLRLLDSEPFN